MVDASREEKDEALGQKRAEEKELELERPDKGKSGESQVRQKDTCFQKKEMIICTDYL